MSEGIYFVVRLPKFWELVSFRFDTYPEGNHYELWETNVTAILVKSWAPELFKKLSGVDRLRRERRLKAELDQHYDGFPRGRITWREEQNRFSIFHGDNLKPSMKVSRASIEKAFEIAGCADWEFDEHEQCTTQSTKAILDLLPIKERWKTWVQDNNQSAF